VMKPLYATYEQVMQEHKGRTFAEIKHDGYRIQIHKSDSGLKMFTGDGKEYNYQCYPEIVAAAERLPVCILEAELVGEGKNHKEVFDKVKKRFRRGGVSQKSIDKYLESGVIDEMPLHLKVFDTLRFEKKGLLYTPLEERRGYTERFDSKGISPADLAIVTSAADLSDLVDWTIKSGHEGRVCKNPTSFYDPGSANTNWVKFKRSEPLDLVVVGIYKNAEYATDLPFSSVLCAAYNDQTQRYETIGKIGVTRNGIAREINEEIAHRIRSERPSNVAFSEKLDRDAFAKYVPTAYVDPEQSVVLEVKAMNLNFADNWHTCGAKDGKAFSMRIGFANQIRYDKAPNMSTKTRAIRSLYQIQEGMKNE
jgi:ATP-dependent DNA ligase